MKRIEDCEITHHAEVRMQQRGVSADAVSVILKYGRRKHTRDGAMSLFCTRRQIKKLRGHLGAAVFRGVEKSLANTYVIQSNSGQVLTVAKRH